ncbi:hypothetical protein T265_01823 [Opisthorchis viverrini]|uniref:SHSP domain-containing protein n=1 Tax=Opisthorchis viverrini TaxID=6198 RepID=A0A075A8J1_OPIVI|nr:hypothetical protein T265_01823 [Opisthorchis viverrini]KER32045.1 hypothetical protein T265_01823 [Opisthorchis viverrini]
MSSILEHVCTFFIVNATTNRSYLKIILDARGIGRESISAQAQSTSELVISASSETNDGELIVRRYVRQQLSVPPGTELKHTTFVLRRSGFLVIDIPLVLKICSAVDQHSQKTEHAASPPANAETVSISPPGPKEAVFHQLDKHQTKREGNELILKIPLDRIYSRDKITVKIMDRSVCVTASALEAPNNTRPYMIQRTFYKEYEASDCIPDPKTIRFDLYDNWLFVRKRVKDEIKFFFGVTSLFTSADINAARTMVADLLDCRGTNNGTLGREIICLLAHPEIVPHCRLMHSNWRPTGF